MSQFQGLGSGISGTSNQFQVGYSQGAGYTYGNIGGTAPQTGYATQSAATTPNLQLIGPGGSSWGWQGQQSSPAWLWGSNQGTVNTVFSPGALQVSYAGYSGSAGNANGGVPQAGYANQTAATTANLQLTSIGGSSWGWQGQSSSPSHLWGANGTNQTTVFNPGALQVSYAGYSGSAGNINAYAPSAGYAGSGPNANGGVPQAGYANQAANTAQLLQIQGTGDMTWYWQGQGGTPNHYWGSNDAVNTYVWQWNQGYVGSSGSAGNVNGYAPTCNGTAYTAGTVGYAQADAAFASYTGNAGNVQGAVGKIRAWVSTISGSSAGVSSYQGGVYGQIAVSFATNINGWDGAVGTGYTGQFGFQGANYLLMQKCGGGLILVG